jgi:hypothetical protein
MTLKKICKKSRERRRGPLEKRGGEEGVTDS